MKFALVINQQSTPQTRAGFRAEAKHAEDLHRYSRQVLRTLTGLVFGKRTAMKTIKV
jgi:hypothetical protein